MTTSSATAQISTDEALEQKFRALADVWRREVGGYSLLNRIVAHPAYREIVEMGEAVLPLILEDLRDGGGHWYRALREITGENPVPEEDRGWSKKMRRAWVEWGEERGWIE